MSLKSFRSNLDAGLNFLAVAGDLPLEAWGMGRTVLPLLLSPSRAFQRFRLTAAGRAREVLTSCLKQPYGRTQRKVVVLARPSRVLENSRPALRRTKRTNDPLIPPASRIVRPRFL